MSFSDLERTLLTLTESALSRRKRRRLVRRHRQLRRRLARRERPLWRRAFAVALEWAATFIVIFIVAIVFQMAAFQNYRIPSESMLPTLRTEDLILVGKIDFGPEILPGALKLPAVRLPRRGEIVSFESELYARRGPWVELAERFVYVCTLSFVNLKTDRYNRPIVDLLIKRAIGLPGDRVRQFGGRFEIMPACENRWVEESELMAAAGVFYTTIGNDGLKPLPPDLGESGSLQDDPTLQEAENVDFDRSAWERSPQDEASASAWIYGKVGWYVPGGAFFPMGDNRPNSRDARVYGPVPLTHIQGRALLRFYPFSRFGAVE